MSTTTTSNIPTIKLYNGVEMPQLSLGLAFWNVQKGGVADSPNFIGFLPERVYRSLDVALESGIRSIDTALIYRSHVQIRHVLGNWLAEGKIKREDIFVATKVYHPYNPLATSNTCVGNPDAYSPARCAELVEQHIEKSLEELGLGYIDLLFMHWPAQFDSKDPNNGARRLAAWRVFEQYYEMGWIRAIGVSNWTEHHIEQLMKDGAKYKPMVNQVEGNIYLQWSNIVRHCKDNDIAIEAFSPLGHGGAMLKDSTVSSIAKKHNKDNGQVAMRYLIEKGYAVTFSTTSEKRLVTNQQIFDFKLDDDDMKLLDDLNGKADSTGQPQPYDMS
mmetsp:Transcript_55728/g.135031  ORF Transcript_55728/g.135031 Transcript_55728/m.135031 type:complete len:330 (-) Transcript_55728:118-1107(-)